MIFEELAKESKPGKETLFVIGNGFDLCHGIQSTYRDYRTFLKSSYKGSLLLDVLETQLSRGDIWGNFEESLAYLDREKMTETIDFSLDVNDVPKDEHDEDFSYADFECAIEQSSWPIDTILNDLPKSFARWIQTLKIPANPKPFQNLMSPDSRYLNFNYTETLEMVYGVPKTAIVYLHGDRRVKHFKPILGHGRDREEVFEEWYNANKDRKDFQPYLKNKKGKIHPNSNPTYLAYFAPEEEKAAWGNPVRFYAIEQLTERIEEYYEESAKKTKDAIEKNKDFFASLGDIKHIVVLGHSLSDVDYPYFKKINEMAPKASWHVSYHTPEDQERIKKMRSFCSLDADKVQSVLL
jgi:hypothetical protein